MRRFAPHSPPQSPASRPSRFRAKQTASALAVAALVAGTVLTGPGADPVEAATPTEVRFTSSSPTSWVVPEGVTQIQVFVAGGGGGASFSNAGDIFGGAGATIQALIDVTPGETLVFQAGLSGSPGFDRGSPGSGGPGWRSGGAGNTGSLSGRAGGGGGGASAVLRNGQPLVVAGGGGGGGGRGFEGVNPGGAGGNGGEAGRDGSGGGQNFGGAPGIIGGGNGQVGDDAGTSSSGGGGGGGGGGFFGGAGGGGGGAGAGGGGGGGGGSEFVATGVTVEQRGVFGSGQNGLILVAFIPTFETTTTVVAPSNEVVIGAPFSVDVTVRSSQVGIIPAGEVDLFDGSRLLATQPLLGGVAVFSGVSIGLGERELFAQFRPTTSDADTVALFASEGRTLITGLPVATNTTLTLSANATTAGQSITLTADVGVIGRGAAILTGAVEFFADDDLIATVPLSNQQRASTTFTSSEPGDRVVSARYVGSDESLASELASATVRVNARPTTIRVQAPFTSLIEGEEIVLFAVVERPPGSTGPLNGTVQFALDGVPVGSPQLIINGQARLALPALPVGVRTITATYSGDALNGGSVADPVGLRVAPESEAVPPAGGGAPGAPGAPGSPSAPGVGTPGFGAVGGGGSGAGNATTGGPTTGVVPQLGGPTSAVNAPRLSGPPRDQAAGGPGQRGSSSLPTTGGSDATGVAVLMGLLLATGIALRVSARSRRTASS